jgi:fumarate reductase flavoprotein subunit
VKKASSIRHSGSNGKELAEALRLDNMCAKADVSLQSAKGRIESGGAHVREDFPKRDDENWPRRPLI